MRKGRSVEVGGLRTDQRGITGLETAIVLIAFVVDASVFAFAVLTTGLLSSEKAKEAVSGALEESQATLSLKGSIIGFATGTLADLDRIEFQVGTTAGSTESVDLSTTGLVVTYIDAVTAAAARGAAAQTSWAADFISGSAPQLDPGEAAELIINITGLADRLQTKEFTIEVKPQKGARLGINKRTPPEFQIVTNLD